MLLERTIAQLDIGPMPPDQAREMAELGYLQWLGSLPPRLDYRAAARRACAAAAPFARSSPAVSAFRGLLIASTGAPFALVDLAVRRPHRRGGARSRRAVG